MPKIPQWLSALPNPELNTRVYLLILYLNTHVEGALQFRAGHRVFKEKENFLGWCPWPVLWLYQAIPHHDPHTQTLKLRLFWQLCTSICGEIANKNIKKETSLTNMYWANVSTEDGTWPHIALPQKIFFDPFHACLEILSLGNYFHTYNLNQVPVPSSSQSIFLAQHI